MKARLNNIAEETKAVNKLREAIRSGDEVAFAEYYEGIQRNLVSFIERLTGDPDEALNIAHDAFVKLWENRDRIDRMDGFIYTTATNASFNVLRRKQVHSKYVNEQLFTQDDEANSPEQAVMYDELLMKIEDTIDSMPPQRRRVFRMSRDENMTYNEIARHLNLSYNTVKEHMQSALQDIRSIVTALAILFILSQN